MTIKVILFILAAVCFLLCGINYAAPKVQLAYFGAMFFSLAMAA